ncbi:MAG: hypothetical protein HY308_10590 [Gammaproteobacteria bacterium]|nr:hypothetical protein [Gammaproteobacteria bacterium]
MQIVSRYDAVVRPAPYRDEFEYETFIGRNTADLIEPLNAMRTQNFRDYPYLYEGRRENLYERQCAEELSQSEHTIIVVAYYGNIPAGFTTAFPLMSAAEVLDDDEPMFIQNGCRPSDFYYWSEAAIAPEFRGHTILSRFNQQIESQAIEWGYDHMCLATIIREDHDPRKPRDYKEPGPLWRRFGYRRTNIQFAYWWPTRMKDGSVCYVPNKMSLWIKSDLRKRKQY